MGNRKYDWSLPEMSFVRAPDICPPMTLKTISARYQIPYQTVRRHAAAHKWTRKRTEFIVPLRLEEWIKTETNHRAREVHVRILECYKLRGTLCFDVKCSIHDKCHRT